MILVLFLVVLCFAAKRKANKHGLHDVTCEELQLARYTVDTSKADGVVDRQQQAPQPTRQQRQPKFDYSNAFSASVDIDSNALALSPLLANVSVRQGDRRVTLKRLGQRTQHDAIGTRLFARKLALERQIATGSPLGRLPYVAKLLAVNESCGFASGSVLEYAPLNFVDVVAAMQRDAASTMCVGLAGALQLLHVAELLERNALTPYVLCSWRLDSFALNERYELLLLDTSSFSAYMPDVPFGSDQRCDDPSSSSSSCSTHLRCLMPENDDSARDADDDAIGANQFDAVPAERVCSDGLCNGFDARSNVWALAHSVLRPMFVSQPSMPTSSDLSVLRMVVDDMLEPLPKRRVIRILHRIPRLYCV
jgi:hypothetical protein